MRQRFHLRHLGAIIVAVGLMLLISCLTVNPPAQAEASGVSTTVVITKNGFDPPVVTIEVGQSVLWTNQSPQAIRVKGGEPHQLYLPMIRTNSGSAQGRTAHESVVSVPVTPAQGTWLDLELAPGQSYSHSFTTIGNYPYFLTTQPDKTGLVRVVEAVADFGVELAPRAQALVQGRLATVTVALTETVRLTQPVALSITGLPSGVSASFNPPTTTTTTVLTLNATAEAATGIYGVTIQGTAGDVSQTATLSLTVASMAFTTTTAPSGIALELNQVVYETGDDLTVVLEFGDIVPPTAVGNVFVASPGSGDVEVIALQATGNGRFTSSAPLPLVAQAGVATPADGTLSLVPGEQFAALYYIDQTQPSLAAVDEEIVADLGLFAGGDTSLAPVSILSELALTDDERVPPPGAKPTGTLLPNGGIPIQIATKEVILFPRSDAELDRFLAKSGGVVLGTQAGDDESLPAVLIAVDTSTAPTAHLAQLRTLFGEAGTLFASNTTVLDMYAFLLAYQLEGYLVAANPRIQPQTAPALQEREALAVTHTMEMVRANTTIGPCIPGDATRPCV
nr:hypothetical protein [Caldilineaceae bacterium]